MYSGSGFELTVCCLLYVFSSLSLSFSLLPLSSLLSPLSSSLSLSLHSHISQVVLRGGTDAGSPVWGHGETEEIAIALLNSLQALSSFPVSKAGKERMLTMADAIMTEPELLDDTFMEIANMIVMSIRM